jgi:GTP-binding protein
MIKIEEAVFVQSNTDWQKCPKPDKPEYAFIGRSNVGKSSLINMLTQKPGLAKTSQTPGKTQTINHFLVNQSWYLVDLPGYGYAKISRSEKEKWKPMIRNYLENRENLICIFILLDSRHPPQKADLEFLTYLGENQIPFAVIFTKADKQTGNRTQENLENYRKTLLETWEELPTQFVTSAISRMGREEILNYINGLNNGMTDSLSN